MSTLIVLRSTPYGNTNAKDALDVVLTLAAFEQQPALLYQGLGVQQLLLDASMQSPFKHVGKILGALPMYDVEQVYVDLASMEEYGILPQQLASLPVACHLLTSHQVSDLMHSHQHVMVL